jgi:hypothetical protein
VQAKSLHEKSEHQLILNKSFWYLRNLGGTWRILRGNSPLFRALDSQAIGHSKIATCVRESTFPCLSHRTCVGGPNRYSVVLSTNPNRIERPWISYFDIFYKEADNSPQLFVPTFCPQKLTVKSQSNILTVIYI